MSVSLTGHCLCGAMRYRVHGEPLATGICHCDDCQRQSGAPFSLNVLVELDHLVLEGDTLKTVETTGTETGEKRERQFCGACGSPLVTLLAEEPEIAVIKAGTLDDRTTLAPEMEVWCDRRHPWLDEDNERGCFPTGLPL